jgi:hypothetical protein
LNRNYRPYTDLPLEEEVLFEILMDSKKRELELTLLKIPDSKEIILYSKAKK